MKHTTVRLGYQVPTGEGVDIPVRHMCIAGQTQEAGKTTALEGLIARSGLRAITFITKRGEGSFRSARRILPYFREQADWQFVASILEASRGEKLKFERAWIMKASKGASTLKAVQSNCRRLMMKARPDSMQHDMFMMLDNYLDAIVPTIGKVQWAKSVDLNEGVNVMDLTDVPSEMAHLIIKSTLDWVLAHATDTIVVIPEAWKFIPQGRGTPVKLSAEAFIRQAAGLGNYLWLDSQDIGGIEKTILRSVPVWVLGVQREANEIKRTLSNIPAGTARPSATDLATLELGQFYACWGKYHVKTYAQPTWVTDALARQVATGVQDVRTIQLAHKQLPKQLSVQPSWPHFQSAPVDLPEVPTIGTAEDIARINRIGDDEMTPAQEQKLDEAITAINRLAKAIGNGRLSDEAAPAPLRDARKPTDIRQEIDHPSLTASVVDALYQQFKARLSAEAPELLQVLVSKPELQVIVERQTIKVDGSSTRGRIARLISEGFFEQARTSADVAAELAKRGKELSNIELGNELKALVEMGFFTKSQKWLSLVPDMVVNVIER